MTSSFSLYLVFPSSLTLAKYSLILYCFVHWPFLPTKANISHLEGVTRTFAVGIYGKSIDSIHGYYLWYNFAREISAKTKQELSSRKQNEGEHNNIAMEN